MFHFPFLTDRYRTINTSCWQLHIFLLKRSSLGVRCPYFFVWVFFQYEYWIDTVEGFQLSFSFRHLQGPSIEGNSVSKIDSWKNWYFLDPIENWKMFPQALKTNWRAVMLGYRWVFNISVRNVNVQNVFGETLNLTLAVCILLRTILLLKYQHPCQ